MGTNMRLNRSTWLRPLLVVAIIGAICPIGVAQEDPAPKQDLAAEQEQIAEKFQHLEKVLLRMAELNQADDPRRTALLKKAVRLSGDRLIDLQFEQLAKLLSSDQFSRAMENQKDLHGDLQAMLELLLSENRQQRVRAEKARIRNYLKRINRLIKQQKDVQGRTEHSENPDQLSDQQGQLADKAGEISKDIKQNEEGKFDESSESSETPEDPAEEKCREGHSGSHKGRKSRGRSSSLFLRAAEPGNLHTGRLRSPPLCDGPLGYRPSAGTGMGRECCPAPEMVRIRRTRNEVERRRDQWTSRLMLVSQWMWTSRGKPSRPGMALANTACGPTRPTMKAPRSTS